MVQSVKIDTWYITTLDSLKNTETCKPNLHLGFYYLCKERLLVSTRRTVTENHIHKLSCRPSVLIESQTLY